MIFWLVLKLKSSNILKDFGFILVDFWKIIFLHGEIFEFSRILLSP